mgnify:CR=1 FL=1
MEQMVIYSRSNTAKYELPYEDPIRDVTTAKLQRQHMANDYVQLTIHTTETMPLEVGDWIEVRGCRYSIRSASDITRSGEDDYTYNVTFYGAMYNLMRYMFRDTPVTGRSSQNTFGLTLSLKDFIKVIIHNVMRGEGINAANAAQSPWIFDEDSCPDSDPITMSFDKQNCLTALQNIVEQFDVEFLITQELNETYGIWQCTIRVGEFGNVVNNTPFSYGEGNGLYQLQETKVDDSCIVNRLWPEGSTENILSGYRGYSMRLQLPRKNVPLLGSDATRRYSRKEHTIEINGERCVFAAGYPIGIEDDDSRYVDEESLYAGSEDAVHGRWKKEGEENWRYSPFNPSGLITGYGILEDSAVFDDIMPSPTFKVIKPLSTNSRLSFFCDVEFELDAIWSDTFADFREWCLLKTQLVPSQAQYNACKTMHDNEGSAYDEDIDLWEIYRIGVGDGEISRFTNPYIVWRQTHHSASAPDLPSLPEAYSQDIYAEYETFRTYLLSSSNSKYLIDGGQVAFVDGKCAGIDFDIAENGFVFWSDFSSAQRSEVAFSSSRSYAVGDYCIRNNHPYRFTEAHTGLWNSNHVTEAPFGLLTINIKTEQDTGDVFPSEDEFGAFRIAPGDKFKLVSIYFPYEYYEDAEEELWFAAYEKFESIKYAQLRYKLAFDQMFVDENKAIFEAILPGDYITITDDRFGFSNKKMRVTQVDCNLLNDIEYQITLQSVQKKRTRHGLSLHDYNELYEAISEVGINEPRYRRNNRTSGNGAMSFITANGYLRAERVADEFVATRMLADQAISAAKILDGAVSRAKIAARAINASLLDDYAVTAAKIASGAITSTKISAGAITMDKLAQAVNYYLNNTLTLDRHYEGSVEFASNVLKLNNLKFVDSYTKELLGHDVASWTNAADIDIDFTDTGTYEADKGYSVYAVLESDGTCTYHVALGDEEVENNYMKIGDVSAEDGGTRTFTPCIGDTYIQKGAIRDSSGNAVLDMSNGRILGTLKFTGLKDGSNNDLDILSVLGSSPTTTGSLRKRMTDAEDTIGADDTAGLRKRIKDNEDAIGDNNSGLVKAVNANTSKIGNATTSNTLVYKINELIDDLTTFNTYWRALQTAYNGLLDDLQNNGGITQAQKNNRQVGIQQCSTGADLIERCSATPRDMTIPTKFTS